MLLRSLSLASCLLAGFLSHAQILSSPDRQITVKVAVNSGKPSYTVWYKNKPVLRPSRLGLDLAGDNFYDSLKLTGISAVRSVKEAYRTLNAKKEEINYAANRQEYTLTNARGKKLKVIFQVANDGLGFRYYFPGQSASVQVRKEYTSYNFPSGTLTWLQPKAEAQTGWQHTNPSYEENYEQEQPAGKAAANGWVYPALFRTGETWAVITETGMDGSYCGTVLKNAAGSTDYQTGFPDSRERFTTGGVLPLVSGPWYSPWRVIALGSLKTITESTLGTDLADPAIPLRDDSFIRPGRSSWSWIMSKDDAIVYEEQKKYIDFAADMHWEYCLIDADWDTKIGYDKIAELSAYAAAKKVGLLLWYNSAGSWNTVPYHPKDKLLTPESRKAEFTRLRSMGIKGVKIDFFNGDGQSMIRYYTDILKDAAAYGLLVNFHGATLPRGWARTYPHLMTTEAVKGFEMITFRQEAADAEPSHAAMLPFTRNLFDPMDFTPMNLYQIQSSVRRRTTSGFELATSVLFLSGIQHYAESPEGMAHMPEFVKTFLRNLPGHWEDVKFIQGMPGKLAVIARKSKGKWYVAGINGENRQQQLQLDLAELQLRKGSLITDDPEGKNLSAQQVLLPENGRFNLSLQGNGGFVLVLE